MSLKPTGVLGSITSVTGQDPPALRLVDIARPLNGYAPVTKTPHRAWNRGYVGRWMDDLQR